MASRFTKASSGKEVRIVLDATLTEISVVAAGACKEAYCSLITKRDCGPFLSDDVKSKRVLADGAFVGVMRALQQLEKRLN